MSPNTWQRLRATPGIGRIADRGAGPSGASRRTKKAGARIEGLKASESVCPYSTRATGSTPPWASRTRRRTLDNEEHYLIKKAFTAMGAVRA